MEKIENLDTWAEYRRQVVLIRKPVVESKFQTGARHKQFTKLRRSENSHKYEVYYLVSDHRNLKNQ